jgi:hypothetical protein
MLALESIQKISNSVKVVNESGKIGCRGEELYIEVTPSQEQQL